MKNFTVDGFIKFFSEIPEEKWCIKYYKNGGRCCSLGHCGEGWGKATRKQTPMSRALAALIEKETGTDVAYINDAKNYEIDNTEVFEITRENKSPRQRILKVLEYIKNKQNV